MWALSVTETEHKPVLLAAAIAGLNLRASGVYVDGTYGRGGHSAALLQQLGIDSRLIAFDKDPEACAHAWQRYSHQSPDPRFAIERASFAQLGEVLQRESLLGKLDGLLLDLGVSSPQLETAERGFSFMRPGPLDMRMDSQAGVTAAQWLADAPVEDIARVIKEYGEEPFARRIAATIVDTRAETPITTTDQLARLVKDCIPQRIAATSHTHPATRTFQALRIHINDELSDLRRALPQSLDALAPGGRLVVISFHSLEDRIVKRFMREQARPEPPPVPMAPAAQPALRLVGKAQYADAQERSVNPRARSAIMRVAERTEHPAVTP